jgi:hypothetical protein
LSDLTGPEKVVRAISNPHMRVSVYQSACRQSGLSGKRIFPDERLYITKKEGLQALLLVTPQSL